MRALFMFITFFVGFQASAAQLPPELSQQLQTRLEDACPNTQVRVTELETTVKEARLDQGADYYYTTKYFAQFYNADKNFSIRATAELGQYEISNPTVANTEVISLGFEPAALCK